MFFQPCIILFSSFGGRDIAYGLQDTSVVEPAHPGEGGEPDSFCRFPEASVDGLYKRIVVGIANAFAFGLPTAIAFNKLLAGFRVSTLRHAFNCNDISHSSIWQNLIAGIPYLPRWFCI